jgi:hypothetical protein
MTVTQTVTPRWAYTGDGTQTSFPFTALVLDAADLAVYVDHVRQTLITHYTVTGLGVPTGGTVEFVVPPGLVAVDLIRDTVADQPRSFPQSGALPSQQIERGFDDAVNLVQELRRELRRAALLDRFSTASDLSLPDPVALRGLRWKSDLTGLENVDLTTILAAAATLPLALTQGGTGATTALAARQALGLDGQVPVTLTNRTGVTLAAGDVVTLSTAADSSVVLGDTVSSKAPFVVALASIANNATGPFLVVGVATVTVAGAVTRGRYLRKAATTLAAEDSGTLVGAATDPPTGAFAIALAGSAGGSVLAWLLGSTRITASTPTITGLPRVWGLTGDNNGSTPTTQYDLAATGAVVRDPAGGGTLVISPVATRVLDVSAAGPVAGGRDQAGAFSANTWLHAYLIAKTDGTYHVTASLATPPTGPALPSGYTLWAYRGYYRAAQIVVTDGRATVETLVSCTSQVPPTALEYKLLVTGHSRNDGSQRPTLRVASGADNYDVIGITAASGTNAHFRTETTLPNVSQSFYYLYAAAPAVGFGLHAFVRGYENPI